MTRQENAVPIFTYENEESDAVYAERQHGVKRNPYLVDYAKQRSQQGGMRQSRPVGRDERMRASRSVEGNGGMRLPHSAEADGAKRSKHQVEPIDLTRSSDYTKADVPVRSGRRPGTVSDRPTAASRRSGTMPDRPTAASCRSGIVSDCPAVASRRSGNISDRPTAASRRPGNVSARPTTASRRPSASGRPVPANRKKRALMQRLAIGLWALGILALAITIMFKDSRVSAAQNNQEDTQSVANMDKNNQDTSGILVQGLPAEEFAKHPDWKENLLTPNEYSRPGEALETVTNIFVHYTANPGTSAAQNRSYFEQQKDTHERSVSAHFIIGYEGEIIQCVPLDEIAYAVATRNSDSISIECCYLANDGSFTQKTYDSLIALLAWLIDVYDLDSNDILRHYDCGGKKCPIYYTEHPGEWEQLKKDVDKL